MPGNSHTRRAALLLAMVILIGLLHLLTPGHDLFFHDTYRRLSYFPIVLGGLWFGLRGGLILALLSSIAFTPHLLLYLGRPLESYLSELTEILLYIGAGTLTGFIAGREKKTREQYRLTSEKLEQSYTRLHRQTQELLTAEEHLAEAQKISALGQLSASLAHEIKNPLASIRGTAEILRDDFPPGHPKHEFVEILAKESDRLHRTVDEILCFARPQAKGRNNREPLVRIVDRVQALLARQLKDKAITFSVSGDKIDQEPLVESDAMTQVLLNIILNAHDAVPVGGKINLLSQTAPGGYTLTICDNGPGITTELREKIFEPFISAREGGTGLGLVISRKIIEAQGGTLTLAEPEDNGACFIIFLPDSSEVSTARGETSI